jgi:hypothetical protein
LNLPLEPIRIRFKSWRTEPTDLSRVKENPSHRTHGSCIDFEEKKVRTL